MSRTQAPIVSTGAQARVDDARAVLTVAAVAELEVEVEILIV